MPVKAQPVVSATSVSGGFRACAQHVFYRFLLNPSRKCCWPAWIMRRRCLLSSLWQVRRDPFAAVSITVAPSSVNLSPGGTQQFTATVTGAADTSVTWSIQQGGSGGAYSCLGTVYRPAVCGQLFRDCHEQCGSAHRVQPPRVCCRICSHGITESFSRYRDSSCQWDCALYEWRDLSSAEIYNPSTSNFHVNGEHDDSSRGLYSNFTPERQSPNRGRTKFGANNCHRPNFMIRVRELLQLPAV